MMLIMIENRIIPESYREKVSETTSTTWNDIDPTTLNVLATCDLNIG